jgi:hypothetical protein
MTRKGNIINLESSDKLIKTYICHEYEHSINIREYGPSDRDVPSNCDPIPRSETSGTTEGLRLISPK